MTDKSTAAPCPTAVQLMAAQIDRKIAGHRGDGMFSRWLPFQGLHAINLMRKLPHLKAKGVPAPILIVYCERGPGLGEHIYEHFVPSSFAIDAAGRLVTVSGTMGDDPGYLSLTWSPDVPFAQDGKRISYVLTLPQYYPADALNAIRLNPLGMGDEVDSALVRPARFSTDLSGVDLPDAATRRSIMQQMGTPNGSGELVIEEGGMLGLLLGDRRDERQS